MRFFFLPILLFIGSCAGSQDEDLVEFETLPKIFPYTPQNQEEPTHDSVRIRSKRPNIKIEK